MRILFCMQAYAFTEMKRVMARETLLAFPDFNKQCVIHTDASKFQLGSVMSQDGKPIAFYSDQVHNNQKRTPFNCGNTQRVQKHSLWTDQCSLHRSQKLGPKILDL